MKATTMLIALVIPALLAGCAKTTPMPEPAYWPTDAWRTSAPEEQGIASAQLAEMFRAIEEQQINLRSLLIVRNGYLITAAYLHPYQPETQHMLASVTKSVIGMLIGIAIDHGAIPDAKQPMLSFFPDRPIANLDPDKQAITLENLLALNSGLDCQDRAGTEAALVQSPDWVQFMLDLPMADKPGDQFRYCSGAVHLLSAILQQATGTNPREFANQYLFAPLGIEPVAENAWLTDPSGLPVGGWGLYLRPQDMAKLGYLYLNQGRWDGRQIVPADWVSASAQRHSTWTDEGRRDYGYLFWLYPQHGYYSAMGLGGQQIHVVPDKNIVVVFTSGVADDTPLAKFLTDYILAAVRSDRPLDPNPEAVAMLNERLQAAAEPVQPVPTLSTTAQRISGQTITLAPNDAGFERLVLTFREGAETAQVTINSEAPVEIGLDHLYRMEGQPAIGTSLVRGGWEDEHSFVVEELELGNLDETEYRLTFSGQEVRIQMWNRVFEGTPNEMLGTLPD